MFSSIHLNVSFLLHSQTLKSKSRAWRTWWGMIRRDGWWCHADVIQLFLSMFSIPWWTSVSACGGSMSSQKHVSWFLLMVQSSVMDWKSGLGIKNFPLVKVKKPKAVGMNPVSYHIHPRGYLCGYQSESQEETFLTWFLFLKTSI